MSYDLALGDRVRRAIEAQSPGGLAAKEMFGGIGYMIRGNMACGVIGERVLVRVGPDRYQETLAEPGVSVFDMTGRPMRGWVLVDGSAFESEETLHQWVARGVAFASTLPAK